MEANLCGLLTTLRQPASPNLRLHRPERLADKSNDPNDGARARLPGSRLLRPAIASVLLAAVLAASACSSADEAASEPVVTSETSDPSASIATPTPDSATVTIASEGSIVDESGDADASPSESMSTTTPPDTDGPGQETDADVSLSIECTRGNSLNRLGIDITRVPFVDDDAPDETAWIEIITEFVNPTGERVAVDPGFEVTFLDDDGEELATQPWADGANPVHRGLEATTFVIEPNQTFARRIVVFDGYSGTLFLRDNHDRLLESLDRCALSGEPDVTTLQPYEPPAGVSLEIGTCAPTEDGSIFETTLVAKNTGDAAVQLVVFAELVDDAGDRIAVVGSGELPVSIEPGTTETRTLGGAAWPIDDLSSIADCRIYSAEAAPWQT